jgi:hypothetical protein
VPRHSHSMAKPDNAADGPLWAKPRRGRAFASVGRRYSSFIGNKPTALLVPCPSARKYSVAAAGINQRFLNVQYRCHDTVQSRPPEASLWRNTPAGLPHNIEICLDHTLTDRRNATSTTELYRGCSHSLMFRLPRLLDPQVAPTAEAFGPQGG